MTDCSLDDRVETPFVGRDDELRLLKDLFHTTARERRARLVSVVGPARIGQTRLAWEFLKYVDGLVEPVWWHDGRSPRMGTRLRALAARAVERRYFEMPWPTANHDKTPTVRPKRWSDPVFEEVPIWGPPSDVDGFLEWLAQETVPGIDAAERVHNFIDGYPAAGLMPTSLREELEQRFGAKS